MKINKLDLLKIISEELQDILAEQEMTYQDALKLGLLPGGRRVDDFKIAGEGNYFPEEPVWFNRAYFTQMQQMSAAREKERARLKADADAAEKDMNDRFEPKPDDDTPPPAAVSKKKIAVANQKIDKALGKKLAQQPKYDDDLYDDDADDEILGTKAPKMLAPYSLKKGDTIIKVAKKFGLDWRKVLRANNLSLDQASKLPVGFKVKLPADAKASKSSRRRRKKKSVEDQLADRFGDMDPVTSLASFLPSKDQLDVTDPIARQLMSYDRDQDEDPLAMPGLKEIIKQELINVVKEQAQVDPEVLKREQELKKRAIAIFKDLASAGLPKGKAKAAAIAAFRLGQQMSIDGKTGIEAAMARIQSNAQLAHIKGGPEPYSGPTIPGAPQQPARKASMLRAKLRKMVAAGKTDQEVKQAWADAGGPNSGVKLPVVTSMLRNRK